MVLRISDVTLRDGSYVTNFSFTEKFTMEMCSKLEDAGVEMIEVGHGYGLGGRRKFGGLLPDSEYIKAAKSSTKRSMIGVFFIPGIGTSSDIKEAASLGINFIRIGTNINEIDKAEEYVKLSKDLGIHCTNFLMKTYAASPNKCSEKFKTLEKFGADSIMIVDSSGGMWPALAAEYVLLAKNNTSLEIGFHGHNNLGLAIANSLAAVNAGATYIDSTIMGIGRSGGNTQTEVFIALLKKIDIVTSLDFKKLSNLAENMIEPLWKKGINNLDIVLGMTDFHSSFLPLIEKYSKEFGVDRNDLILETTKIEKENIDETIVKNAALKLRSNMNF